jgi:hypothetical protein
MPANNAANETTITQMLLPSRIIAGALPAGVIIFVVVAISLRLGQPPGETFLAPVGAGFAVVIVLLRIAVLGVLGRQRGSSAPETLALVRLYQVRMIVGLAMLEGAALFNAVAFLLEGHWWSLAVVGVLLAFMLAAFPTRMAVQQWLDDRKGTASFRAT